MTNSCGRALAVAVARCFCPECWALFLRVCSHISVDSGQHLLLLFGTQEPFWPFAVYVCCSVVFFQNRALGDLSPYGESDIVVSVGLLRRQIGQVAESN